MSFELWIAFTLASTLLVTIPGPTVLLVLSYALSGGRKVAVATALGVATGDLIAISASLLGLGALMQTSALAFTVLKWLGAAYLLYLGIRMLTSRSGGLVPAADAPTKSAWHMFREAMVVTALNPKSIGFFIAFVPQFLRPEAALAPQFAVLIATFVTIGGLNALAYALLAGTLRDRLLCPKIERTLTRIGGAVLIAMGLMTAALKRNAA